MILFEAFSDEEFEFSEPPPLKIGFSRFIASMVMHVMVSSEINNGLLMMKYAANHWWKFDHPWWAWLSGFFQVTALVLIAVVNYFVITVSDSVLDIAKDFTALYILAEFDDLLGEIAHTYANTEEPALDCLTEDAYEDMMKIDVTTSRLASGRKNVKLEPAEILGESDLGEKFGKEFKSRSSPKDIHIGGLSNWWNKRPCSSKI